MFSLLSSCLLPHHVWTASILPPNLQLGGKPCRLGPSSSQEKMLISHFRKIPVTKYKFHVIMQHKFHLQLHYCCCIIFLTSGFMYRYIMLILITQWLQNLICNMAKALNGQNFSKQNFQPLSPSFSAIWKTLLQLLLLLLFTPSLFYFELYKLFLAPRQLWLHSLRAN